jgi:integrase
MSRAHSTTPAPAAKAAKPPKPYPDFPLTAHPAGYWCKKIRGRLYYFGKWADPEGALRTYLEQRDDLHAGRTPRPDPQELTVKDLANLFLNAKQQAVAAGELAPRTLTDYVRIMGKLVSGLGKLRPVAALDPRDFTALKAKLAQRNGPTRLSVIVTVIRCAFKYAYDAGALDRPQRFGPDFRQATKKVMRLHRARQGPKLFTAEEVRRMLGAAGVRLRAMILLGINCGFGNADCGRLPQSAVDLEGGWIDFARPKTGIPRRCPLWPETVAALREALAQRAEPKSEADAGLVFITRYGLRWGKDTTDCPISNEFGKLLRKLGINGRARLGFYTLRHTFRTVADEAKDQPAADYIMGHESPHMSTVYRERIADARLRAVAEYVRGWLFGG